MATVDVDVSKLPDLSEMSGLLSDRVYEAVRAAILSLDFTPGAVIRKGALCEELGVSRQPVSDAILKLAGEGLVEVVPQSATRVSKLSMREVREDAFLREALEVAAVKRAAEVRSDEQLSRLARNLRLQHLQVEDGDYDEFYRTDQAFHRLIIDCCEVRRLNDTIRLVSNHVDRARLLMLPEPGRTVETLDEHAAILEAIRVSDPEAAGSAMQTHLRQLTKRLEPLEKSRPEMFSP